MPATSEVRTRNTKMKTDDQFLVGSTVMGLNTVVALLICCRDTGVSENWSEPLQKCSDDFVAEAQRFIKQNKPKELYS